MNAYVRERFPLPLLGVTRCAPGILLALALGCGAGTDGMPVTSTALPTRPEPAPPPAPEPPSAPVVRITSGEDFVEWSWDPVEGATSYEGYAYPFPLPPEEQPPFQTILEPIFRVDGLEPGETWDFVVRAVRETAGGRAVSPLAEGPLVASPALPVTMDLSPDGFMDMWAFNASDWRDGTGQRQDRLRLQTKRPRLGRVSPRFSAELRAHIQDTFDDFVERLSGGLLPPGGPAIDVLTFHPSEGVVDGCIGQCGCALRPQGRIYVDEGGLTSDGTLCNPTTGSGDSRRTWWRAIYVHELAHIMGFSHVYRGNYDSTLGRGSAEPTPLDRLHAELAYCLGDGTPRAEALDPNTQAHCYAP